MSPRLAFDPTYEFLLGRLLHKGLSSDVKELGRCLVQVFDGFFIHPVSGKELLLHLLQVFEKELHFLDTDGDIFLDAGKFFFREVVKAFNHFLFEIINKMDKKVIEQHLTYKLGLVSYKGCMRDCIKDGASKDPGEAESTCFTNCLERENKLKSLLMSTMETLK